MNVILHQALLPVSGLGQVHKVVYKYIVWYLSVSHSMLDVWLAKNSATLKIYTIHEQI